MGIGLINQGVSHIYSGGPSWAGLEFVGTLVLVVLWLWSMVDSEVLFVWL